MISLEVPANGSRLPIASTSKLGRFLTVVGFLGLLYAIYSRHWSYFLLYAPWFGIQAAIYSYTAIGVRIYKGERPKKMWVALLGPIPLMLFVGIMYYGVFVSAKDVFLWFDPRLTSPVWRAVFMGLAVLLVGTVLFLFRLAFRFTYGFHEVVVGVGIAGYHAYRATGVPSAWDSGVYLALVTAGVYLVVRGFDNMHQGITKEPYDPFGRDIFRDYFDQKTNPNMVKISITPSDMFFGIFPELPTPKGVPSQDYGDPLPVLSNWKKRITRLR